MAENGNGIDIRRVSIPVVLAFMVAAACIGGTTTIIFIRINDLSRITSLEAKIDQLDGRILGDRFPGWHRRDQFEWCIMTERLNTGWQCHDPYMLPSGRETSPTAYLRPPIWNGVKAQ